MDSWQFKRSKDGTLKVSPNLDAMTDENGWIHIALSRQNTEFKTFINGLLYRIEYGSKSRFYNFIKNIPVKICYHYSRFYFWWIRDEIRG